MNKKGNNEVIVEYFSSEFDDDVDDDGNELIPSREINQTIHTEKKTMTKKKTSVKLMTFFNHNKLVILNAFSTCIAQTINNVGRCSK